MKIKKIICYLIVGITTLGLLTGCTETAKEESVKKEEETVKGKCTVEECIKLIEPSNTIEEINEIIGFEAEKSEYSETYKWKLSEKTWIDATPSTTDSSYSLSANFDKTKIKNDKADFSNFSDIKASLGKGQSFTYEEMNEKVGGVEGTVVGKSSLSKRYTWVNAQGGYLTASFSEKTGKCTIVTGRY